VRLTAARRSPVENFRCLAAEGYQLLRVQLKCQCILRRHQRCCTAKLELPRDVALLWNDTNTGMVLRAREARDAAAKLGVGIQFNGVHDLVDFAPVFASIEGGRSNALLTLVDPFTSQHRKLIVEFAARRRLPAIYEAREFVESGGLISYGPNLVAIERRAAEYVDRILKGAKPVDLPVEQPTKIEMLINMKTAKTLGLTIPQSVLLRADEVVE
jgi:putative tryptophan/tyrosine transport system substrate-binding protein